MKASSGTIPILLQACFLHKSTPKQPFHFTNPAERLRGKLSELFTQVGHSARWGPLQRRTLYGWRLTLPTSKVALTVQPLEKFTMIRLLKALLGILHLDMNDAAGTALIHHEGWWLSFGEEDKFCEHRTRK